MQVTPDKPDRVIMWLLALLTATFVTLGAMAQAGL
jgi:hypothetical protein